MRSTAKCYKTVTGLSKGNSRDADSLSVREHDIRILNVAGSRESKEPGIHQWVNEILSYAFFRGVDHSGMLGDPSEGWRHCRRQRLNQTRLARVVPTGAPREVAGNTVAFSTANSPHAQSDLGNTDQKVTLLFDYDPMSLTTEERVERERQRREAANARMREKTAAAWKRGICRCGGKLDKKPGTTRNYSTCPDCREKGKASANRYYREGPLQQQVRPPAKLDGRLRDSTGVRRRLERDGLGREAWWWIANALVDGKQHSRRWSVDKHGDRGAWRQAMAQRREWEREKSNTQTL